jgi:peptidoglycan-N-acetylglucosamine deacetylase
MPRRVLERDAILNVATVAYHRVPRRIRGDRIRRVGRQDGRVSLTFDDCNEPDSWERILDTLATHGLRATFFPIGEVLQEYADLARRTVSEGHAVGSHGWDHSPMRGMSFNEARRRIRRDAQTMRAVAGPSTVPLFRPPYCSYDRTTLFAASCAGHFRTILWDVDSYDWKEQDPSEIVGRVLDEARSGSIALLHTRSRTAEALPDLLDGLKRRGLHPVSVPELISGYESAVSARVAA